MSCATLSIGGVALRLEGGDSVAKAMSLPGFGAFVSEGDGMTLAMDANVIMPECRMLHRFSVMDGREECSFMVDADGVYYYTYSGGGTLRLDPRTPDCAECSPMQSPDKLRFALWLAYGMMGVRHGRLPIHSSTVVHRDRAVLCLGESGTGKSTHTRLWLENIPHCYLLNDDSPILSVEDGAVSVYGSPWSGKTPCYRQEQYPVAALLRLSQCPENTIRRLPTVEAFTALQPSLPPAMAHDGRTLDLLVGFASRVISVTPIYHLGCRPDVEASHLSHNTIYGDDND